VYNWFRRFKDWPITKRPHCCDWPITNWLHCCDWPNTNWVHCRDWSITKWLHCRDWPITKWLHCCDWPITKWVISYQITENHRSLIQICITPSLESTSWFFPSALPVMSRLTSSFTCQLISIIITTLIIHHSFTLSLQAQNLPFQQILPTLDFFYLPDCLHDNGTGPDLSCSSFYF